MRLFGHLVRAKGTQKCEIVWSPGESEGNTEWDCLDTGESRTQV